MVKIIIKQQKRTTMRHTFHLTLIVPLLLALISSSFIMPGTTARFAVTAQDAGPEKLSVRFQFPASPSFQTESEQELTRAIVVARKRKSKAGTVFSAYILLTNVAGKDSCDRSNLSLSGDSEFALAAFINESFKEKEGPESTAIHRVLFGAPDPAQARYFFIASSTHRERLKEILGDVPYHAEPAWPIGWGSRWSVTVIPKGSEKVTPLEVRLEESKFGWTFMLNHASEKKGWQSISPKPTTYVILSRGASGPTLRLQHRDKKLSALGNIPLTVCGLIAEDAPSPFGDR